MILHVPGLPVLQFWVIARSLVMAAHCLLLRQGCLSLHTLGAMCWRAALGRLPVVYVPVCYRVFVMVLKFGATSLLNMQGSLDPKPSTRVNSFSFWAVSI